MALAGALDERLDLVLLSDVARLRLDAAIRIELDRLVERLLAPPAHHDARAERGEL